MVGSRFDTLQKGRSDAGLLQGSCCWWRFPSCLLGSHPGCVWHPKPTKMVMLPRQAVAVPLLLQLLAALLALEEG